jgi:hypothetical protein
MPHVDDDTLALIALGEPAASAADRTHLADCESCSSHLDELKLVSQLGRDSLSEQPLSTPRPEVWQAVALELGLGQRSHAGRRRRAPLLAAALVSVLLAVAGVAGWQLLRPVSPVVVARATLDAFPAWQGSSGNADVELRPDGSRVVLLTLSAPEIAGAYREAWLITQDGTALVSLGVVDSATSVLEVPDGIDLGRYALVDVSAESDDGDPAHSGDSIVRGRLEP